MSAMPDIEPEEIFVQRTPCTTATGAEIHYLEPERTPIREEDLRVHLARVRRYAGAYEITVLQHLALCVELAQAAGASDCLLTYVAAHDLHEAYVGDLPTGLKQCLPDFQRLEELWEARVHHALGLGWPLHDKVAEAVKGVDHRALVVEMTHVEHPLLEIAAGQCGGHATEDEMRLGRRVLTTSRGRAPLWRKVWGAVGLFGRLIEGPEVVP